MQVETSESKYTAENACSLSKITRYIVPTHASHIQPAVLITFSVWTTCTMDYINPQMDIIAESPKDM